MPTMRSRYVQVEDDARRSVDMQLKAACECLIFDVSHQLSAPVMMLHAQLESPAPLPLDSEGIVQALAGACVFISNGLGGFFLCLTRVIPSSDSRCNSGRRRVRRCKSPAANKKDTKTCQSNAGARMSM